MQSLTKMSKINPERIEKIAHIISEVSRMDETDMFILLTLLEDSNMTNAELAKIMNFKDGNSVAYHIRTMQQEGTIEKYSIIPNWKKVGLPTEFILLAEAENEEQLLEIEKSHIKMADEYSSKYGEFVVTQTISGCVILKDIYHCFGDKTMAIVIGRATSDQDAAFFCKNYLASKYPNVKVSMLINKYNIISEFFIDKPGLSKLKEIFRIGKKDVPAAVVKESQSISEEIPAI